MLRVLIFILLPLFATGCLEEEESDDMLAALEECDGSVDNPALG